MKFIYIQFTDTGREIIILFCFQYKIERAWMLSLLSEGLRETADFHIFEKRHVLKMLLSFYESSISDNTTQVGDLFIIPYSTQFKFHLVSLDTV